MIPLGVVSQKAITIYTEVVIPSNSETPIDLNKLFKSKVGREPYSAENIKFIVEKDTVLVGNYLSPHTKSSGALYVGPTDFHDSNLLELDNHGTILGRGGDGATAPLFVTAILGGRSYIELLDNDISGGDAIVNASSKLLHVNNYGTLAGGGGGGAALGSATYSTAETMYDTEPGDWTSAIRMGPGGGGAPYGAGGKDTGNISSLFEGKYMPPTIEAVERIAKTVPLVRSNPAQIVVDIGNPNIRIYDAFDSFNSSYKMPLGNHSSNYLAVGTTLNYRLSSPVGSAHYSKYKTIINGPEADRVFFLKNFTETKLNPSTDTLKALSAPILLGEQANLLTGGEAGYAYSGINADSTSAPAGLVSATGGRGGDIGRVGSNVTPLYDTLIYKMKNVNNPGAGHLVKTIGQVENDLNMPVTNINFLRSTNSTLHGNPGRILSGKVSIVNSTDAVTVGRIDLRQINSILEPLGDLYDIVYFESFGSTKFKTEIDKVVLTNGIKQLPPKETTNFKISEFSILAESLESVTLVKGVDVTGGDVGYLAINEYGMHDHLDVTSTTVTVKTLAHRTHSKEEDLGSNGLLSGDYRDADRPGQLSVAVVAAPVSVIFEITEYINSLNLITLDYFRRAQRSY